MVCRGFKDFLESKDDTYNTLCGLITSEFASVSQAINSVEQSLLQAQRPDIAAYIRQVQVNEKEKLTVVRVLPLHLLLSFPFLLPSFFTLSSPPLFPLSPLSLSIPLSSSSLLLVSVPVCILLLHSSTLLFVSVFHHCLFTEGWTLPHVSAVSYFCAYPPDPFFSAFLQTIQYQLLKKEYVVDRTEGLTEKDPEPERDPEVEHRLKLQQQQLNKVIENINDILDELRTVRDDMLSPQEE